jgi:NADH-quinone oxidoreductase subunit F
MTMRRLERIEDLASVREELRARQRPEQVQIRLCMTGCRALGAEEVCSAFRKEIEAQGLQEKAVLVDTGCQGFCALAPVVTIAPPGVFYGHVAPEDVKEIIARTVLRGEIVERLACRHNGAVAARAEQVPFFSKQHKVVLRNCGEIDPLDVGQYIARDGYQALVRVLTTMKPEQVIDAMTKSGLRGRGGAGFATGVKWKLAREATGTPKYLICNGDEGDPGAFMDRAVLEGDPHSVIEGMLIGSYAIGAEKGYVYVRAEYPIAVRHMRHSVERLREIGLLGQNILGTGLNFDLEIKEGAGAFVCGEETAMIASLEGKRGTPRPRPPFPVQSGLWGKPTTINNVETFANIPPIILKGWEWYAAMGTEKSKGTKVFALAGKVNNPGLVEVPMGATLREIVLDIGGGIPRGRKFKAAQTGGPSGGCVPAKFMDLPLDYESLKQVGAIMGSGGLIIMDEGTCMVDMARYFLDFTQKESCGKCTPCRIGTRRMLEILTRICNGEGQEGDIEKLEEIARIVNGGSLCALGKTAPNPVLSTIRYFRHEYEEHIREHRCRAAVCEAMVKAPCSHLCPAGINVPQYVSLVGLKKYQRAVDWIRRRNPFASICGRICHHPCEVLCRRGDLDEPIAIMELKRIATDLGKRSPTLIKQLRASPTGKKVAIIGAGPAGLSAGYFLSLMGHKVTVHEAGPHAGGMIRTGIPEFRMPSDVLDAEIEFIKATGLKLLTNTPVDAKLFAQLRRESDAIFIGGRLALRHRAGQPGGAGGHPRRLRLSPPREGRREVQPRQTRRGHHRLRVSPGGLVRHGGHDGGGFGAHGIAAGRDRGERPVPARSQRNALLRARRTDRGGGRRSPVLVPRRHEEDQPQRARPVGRMRAIQARRAGRLRLPKDRAHRKLGVHDPGRHHHPRRRAGTFHLRFPYRQRCDLEQMAAAGNRAALVDDRHGGRVRRRRLHYRPRHGRRGGRRGPTRRHRD